ncbi:hypothetical protein B0H13DRAFT_1904644 [Mycena leptocephala]|nr:hypothetical protein B0H13DRAFT_1904644 [Mycena leptocephala]
MPTRVGSAYARHAQSLGASVTLAVRDTEKPIPGLSAEQEKAGGYKRVQADLTQPRTVSEAVKQSGAKHAFVYLIFPVPGRPDPNRAAFEALRAAGVEFVVFLSSFSVDMYEPAIDSVPAQEIIPYAHAQVEVALEEIFGKSGYVALRPGGLRQDAVPEVKFDWIVPEDIRRAGGTILVGGPSSTGGEKSILLCGPELISQGDAVKTIGRVLGKEVAVEAVGDEEAVKGMVAVGIPEPLAKYLVKILSDGAMETVFASNKYNVAVENVRKYAGKVTTLMEWATENKVAFE